MKLGILHDTDGLQKLIDEKKNLDEKLQNLDAFITSLEFAKLSRKQRDRLARHRSAIDTYSRVLAEQIVVENLEYLNEK